MIFLGNCLIVMPKITNSTCKIDRVRRDQVNCDLKFGSWTYHGLKVDIQGKGADKSSYVTNEIWDLTGIYFIICKRQFDQSPSLEPVVTS